MKKKIILSLLAASVLSAGLMGCGNQFPEISSEVSSVAETSKVSIPKVSSAAVKDPAPKHVTDFYNSYVTLKEKHGFSYRVVSAPTPKGISKDGSYEFEVAFSNSGINKSVNFFGFEQKTYQSASVIGVDSYSSEAELSAFKDFITATFLATDPSLSLEDATTKMAEVTNSYSKDSVSEVVSSGDYLIFLVPSSAGAELKVKHKDEVWSDVNKEEYKDVVFEEYQAPAMNQHKVKIRGIVLSRQRVHSVFFEERLKVKSLDDGHTYDLLYIFHTSPVVLSEGKTYDFYGSIIEGFSNGKPEISVYLVE